MSVAWLRCSQILAQMSAEECAGLKQAANGRLRSVPPAVFEKLKAQQLMRYDGKTWTLTEDGRAIVFWC
jgi:hypothetical protein